MPIICHSEADARTKWCPFARVEWRTPNPDVAQPAVNRGDYGTGCMASGCMAWRWVVTNLPDPVNPRDLVPSHDTHGYCGLAGVPTGMLAP